MNAVTGLSIPIEANSNSSTADKKQERVELKLKGKLYNARLNATAPLVVTSALPTEKGKPHASQRVAGVVMLLNNH